MKKVIILIGILCCSANVFSQTDNKFIFGGAFSADFGRFNDRLEVMPTVYKRLVPHLYVGVGVSISYYQFRSTSVYYDNDEATEFTSKTKTTYLGLNMLSQYYLFEKKNSFIGNAFLHAEIEFLKGKGNYKDDFVKQGFTTNNTSVFTGIGYKHKLKDKLSIKTSLLFKLNEEADSPYRNPVFRIGIEF